MKHRVKELIIALLIILPSLWPLFNSKFFLMHDYTHVTRLVEMERAINEGQFPVRWSRNLGYGYGMPLFNFYGPLIYYFGYVILQFGLTYVTTVKLIFGLNFLMSFLAMFYFAKYFWGKWGGLVAATAFIYIPYRAVDFYVRGALGELTGITMIALSLYFLLMLRVKKSVKWVGLAALSIAGVFLSHNLMALIGIPTLFLVTVLLVVTQKAPLKIKFRKMMRNLAAFGLGAGIASFYWLPALAEKGMTSVEALVNEAGHYSLHFAYLRQFINSPWGYNGSVWGVADELSFEIGKMHLVLMVLSAGALYKAFKRGKRMTVTMLGVSGLIVVASILLSTQKTLFLWQWIPGLNYLQFPWRFLSLIIIFSSFMVGGVVLLRQKQQKLIAVMTILILVLFNLKYFKPRGYLEENEALYYTNEDKIQTMMSQVIPDYVHPQVGLKSLRPEPPNVRYAWVEGTTVIPLEAEVDRGHEFLVVVPPRQEGVLRVNIFDFPGWKVFVNGRETDFEVGSDLPVIEVLFSEDGGETERIVSGKLTETPLRQSADWVGVISGLIVAGNLMETKIIKRKKR